MLILYDNRINENTEISCAEAQIGFDLNDLYDPRLSRYVRFDNPGVIDIQLEFPTTIHINAVGFAGHNFSKLTKIAVNNFAYRNLRPDKHSIWQTNRTSQVFNIRIKDPVPGTKQLGRLMIGTKYRTPYISDNVTLDLVDNSEVFFSSSRQPYGNRRGQYKRISVQFPVIEQGHESDDYKAFIAEVGNFKPFILDYEIDCFDEHTFYGVVSNEQGNTLQLNDAHFWTSMLTIEETF